MRKVAVYAFFAINAFVILGFWWKNARLSSDLASTVISFGMLAGLLAAFFVLLQFLLIGRATWIERTFGLDKLTRIHHLNGFLSIFFILLHPILLTIGYASFAKTSWKKQFIFFLTSFNDVSKAFVAVLLFILIIFFSIYIIKKKLKYETWYFIHLLTYLAVFLAFGHQLKVGSSFQNNQLFVNYWYTLYLFVFGNQLVFRFLKPLYLFNKHNFFVEKLVSETTDTTSIYISGKKMNEFSIDPGQFMIFRFLAHGLWWQAHPFSLSKVKDGKDIRISIKKVGDFTSEIKSLKPSTRVLIEGPYGTFTEKKNNKVLLIAGGIGITPIRSLLEKMSHRKRKIILLYSNKTEKEIVFKKEIDSLRKKYGFQVYYFLSKEQRSGFLFGRIDGEKIKSLVKDVRERDVYICGPVSMMNAVRSGLVNMGVLSSSIYLEKFSL